MLQRFLLSLFLSISPYVFAEDSSEESEDKAKWDVSSDQYHTQEISIDTTATTWSNVTVSHDGKTLVFDMLGVIYSVPMASAKVSPPTGKSGR